MSDIIIDRQAAIDEPLLPSLEQLTHWVGCVFSRHPDDDRLELTIRFVDEEESQALNRDYREKDKPTNVLSFPADLATEQTASLLGDIAICSPVVLSEANEQGKSEQSHWAHLTVHGVLHLLGYDHIAPADAQTMEALEVAILRGLGFNDPYQLSDQREPSP